LADTPGFLGKTRTGQSWKGRGGGIHNLDTLKVINSPLSHNHASVGGGGIDNAGPLLFPWITKINHDKPVRCRDRLGGHPCRHALFPPGWVAHYR
jgi:hypothetical protein